MGTNVRPSPCVFSLYFLPPHEGGKFRGGVSRGFDLFNLSHIHYHTLVPEHHTTRKSCNARGHLPRTATLLS